MHPKLNMIIFFLLSFNDILINCVCIKNNVVDVLENAEKVVLDYLVSAAKKENKSFKPNRDLISNVLMSKLQQNNVLSL